MSALLNVLPSLHRTPARFALTIAGIAAALTLSACSFGRSNATPTPVVMPTYAPGLQATPAAVTQPAEHDDALNTRAAAAAPSLYTGEIVAKTQTPLVPEVAGEVIELNAQIGDHVQAGDVLLKIDGTVLEAQRAQALAGLQAAQAQLDLLQTDPKEEDLEAARAAIAAAEAAYQRALDGPTAEDLRAAEAQLRQAEAAVKTAQAAYDQVSWSPMIASLPQSLQLEQATLAHEAAQAIYDKLIKGATADVIAGAYAQLANARAQLNRLETGAQPAAIDAAAAQVKQAETALYLSQLHLDKTSLRAPVDGIIAQVNTSAGSMVAMGTPVIMLLSPDTKIIIPVEETRLPELRLGQQAIIRVNAYPDRTFAGTVTIIAPALDAATRTVPVTIEPAEPAPELAPGMYASVDLLP